MSTKVIPSTTSGSTYYSQSSPQLASLFAQLSAIGPDSTVQDRIQVLEAVATVIQPQSNTDQKFDQKKQDFFVSSGTNLLNRAPEPPISNDDAATQVQISHIEAEADKAALELRRHSHKRATTMKNRTAERVAQRVLKNMKLFKGICSKEQIKTLVEQMKRRHYHEGDALCTEGEIADEFMAITAGGCTVIKDGERISSLQAKDFIGERVLVAKSGTHRRGASVIAHVDTIVMVLTRTAMNEAAGFDDGTKQQIEKRAQDRMQELLEADTKRMAERKKQISHEIEYVSQFNAAPIGLVLEGKNKALLVKGFEGKEDVPDVELGDRLAGVNGVVFKDTMTHVERIEQIQQQSWPLKILFRRRVEGDGPPAPSSVTMQFPASQKEEGDEREAEMVVEVGEDEGEGEDENECVLNVDDDDDKSENGKLE